ncbi:MAG: DUF2867 domain-containing protein [Gemmatimonadota bacterium]|nr:MAG: DUF2867 domain-containing protein [Gemmatimonadota bacterium]
MVTNTNTIGTVLVTGATGYIGGRLVPRLLEEGYCLRVMVRDATRLQGRSWVNRVEIAEGDPLKPETLSGAFKGLDVAYAFIHSRYRGADFHTKDMEAAKNFGAAAKAADVKRIIYLGGLGDPETKLSEHLRSRQLTAKSLSEGGVPVTHFRAAIIIGSGSASFEMIRYMTERVPPMICPRWVFSRIQPIAIDDVMSYLAMALKVPESAGKTIDIGGRDVITYADTFRGYAKVRGLRRVIIPVPVLTPRLSSHWVHWVTPMSAKIARPLIEGLRNEVVVRNDLARSMFPGIHPIGYEEAVRRALKSIESGRVESTWSDALCTSCGDKPPAVLTDQEGIITKRIQKTIEAPAESVYTVVTGLGGKRGWLYSNWAWWSRGLLDRLFGGVGLRRGRRHPENLRAGDVVDFWRVEKLETNRLLRLRSELKFPGRLWLQFEIHPGDTDTSILVQTFNYVPKGFPGFLYWYLLLPLHNVILSGLARQIKKASEKENTEP